MLGYSYVSTVDEKGTRQLQSTVISRVWGGVQDMEEASRRGT